MESSDELIKNKIEEFEQQPDPKIWDAETNWKAFSKQKSSKVIQLKPLLIKLSVAASLLILVYCGWMIRQNSKVEVFQFSTISSVESKQINTEISVTLNKNSSFKLHGNIMEVNGEAYIQIHSKKEYQLRVAQLIFASQNAEINLNTKVSPDEIKISVTQGKAFLKQENGANLMINKNYDCQINPNFNVFMVSAIENQNYLAWRTGKLEFDDVPLSTVTAELSRYYGTKIECGDKNSADHYVSIRFDDNTLPEALQRLKTQNGVSAIMQENVYIINKPGS